MGQGRRAIIWALGIGCAAGATCASAQADAPEQPAPAFGRTVVLRPVGGKVLIEVPSGSPAFTRLIGPRAVPVGTVVNTTAGRVALTSANPSHAAPPRFQTGQFFGGRFRVDQMRSAGGRVDLVLRDNLSRAVCAPPTAHGAALSQRILGLLRGVAKGRFRTVGRFSAATVRGTNWGVRDRCDGTLTLVRAGVVVVTDFVRHRSVTVRAGETYLASAP